MAGLPEMSLTEAVPLAHALVDSLARGLGVRVLFIKGPIAGVQELRPVRTSLDVDALVDPARRDELASALTALGWVDEHPYTSPTILPQHSLTHRHHSWPCELDVHDRFPGFFADPQQVFEALWTRRTTETVAGRDVDCPDPLAHSLILALHSLRDPHDASHQAELAELVARMRTRLDRAELRELAQLASGLGAADTAAPYLRLVAAPEVGIGSTSSADLHAWHLRTDPVDSTAVSWVNALRELPLRRWPSFLWYAATLSDHELRLAEPNLPPGRRAVLKARVERLRRGLRALPSALQDVRELTRASQGTVDSRIVVVTLLRPEGDTGVQTHLQTFLDGLATLGRPATLVTPFSARSPLLTPIFGLRTPLRLLSRTSGVWWYRHWHAHYLAHALRRRLAALGDDTVVYAQCPVSAEVALRVRRSQPVVMVEHFNVSQADEWAEMGEITRGGRLFRSIRTFEERVLPALDGIVFVSDFARRSLEERIPGLTSVRSAVIPNFVAPSVAHESVRQDRDLITIGTLEPRKNQAYLLRILAAASAAGHRYTLTVVGGGPDRAMLEELAESLGLTSQVRFVGQQPNARSLLAGHRLYCHTATIENLPLAVMEAMAEGLPVVAAPVGGIPEILEVGRQGESWPLGDTTAASRVLIELLSDTVKLARMAESARIRVAQEFTSQSVVPRLEAFLVQIPQAGRRHVGGTADFASGTLRLEEGGW